MSILDRLFGRRKDRRVSEDKERDERLEGEDDKAPPKQDHASKDPLQHWARQACNGKTSIRIQWLQVSRLVDVLTKAIQEFRPGVPCTMDDIRNATKLKCAVCGYWDPQLINILYVREHIGCILGFGRLAELANSGLCPRCHTSEVKVTFSPGKIGLRMKPGQQKIRKESTANDDDRSKASLGEEIAFRMVIEDAIPLQSGKVFVGSIQSGSIAKGDKVECRTRAGAFLTSIDRLEAFGKSIDQAHAGQKVGVYLCDCPMEKENSIGRGDVFCAPNEQEPPNV